MIEHAEHVNWSDILSGLAALVGIIAAILTLAVIYLRSFVRGELQSSQENILKNVSVSFREAEEKREKSFERMGQDQRDMIREIDIKLEKYTLKEVLSAMIEPLIRRMQRIENGEKEKK